MRYLTCAALAVVVLALSGPSRVWAFEMNAANSSDPGDSSKYTDPDEQIEAMAGSGDNGQSYGLRLPALGSAPGAVKLDSADHSVPWDAQHIRLVFGPAVRYVHN